MTQWNIRRRLRRLLGFQDELEEAFVQIYQTNGFGGDESVSGPGSALKQTELLRAQLPAVLRDLGIRSLLDAPCGDFFWMKNVSLPLDTYFGGDVVPALIFKNQQLFGDDKRHFQVLDITCDLLPQVDAILCRDCLVHLPNADIHLALANFRRSGARWLLTTTFTGRQANADIRVGQWRPINLEVAPFRLPPPVRLIEEGCTEVTPDGETYRDKMLGVWPLL
jgi:hypothetical protein